MQHPVAIGDDQGGWIGGQYQQWRGVATIVILGRWVHTKSRWERCLENQWHLEHITIVLQHKYSVGEKSEVDHWIFEGDFTSWAQEERDGEKGKARVGQVDQTKDVVRSEEDENSRSVRMPLNL